MSFKLHSVQVERLFNRRSVTIPFTNNRAIMVGMNGLGKTTIINIIFRLITTQWRKLARLPFDSVTLRLSTSPSSTEPSEEIRISKSELEDAGYPTKQISPSIQIFLNRFPGARDRLMSGDVDYILDIADSLDVTAEEMETAVSILRLEAYKHDPHYTQLRLPGLERDDENEDSHLDIATERITKIVGGRVLYLPTYRRIERDIEQILSESEARAFGRRVHGRRQSSHLEFVEFGMRDVESLFQKTERLLTSRALNAMSRLTSEYLRDVVQGKATEFNKDVVNEDYQSLEDIWRRLEGTFLSSQDKELLQKSVSRTVNNTANDNDTYVAHFIEQLAQMHRSLSEGERDAKRLVEICNNYLRGKRLEFEKQDFKIRLKGDDGSDMTLASLSSGEKQVVSLFSHLLLSREKNVSLLIDEPELSLSVAWQKMLLPDIIATDKCDCLIAATHSPFIFDNFLDPEVFDLGKVFK